MSEIDDMIKKALTEEESEVLKSLEEESLFDMLTANFKGKLGWISVYAAVLTFVFFGISIYAAIEFFKTDVVKELIMWSAVFMFSIITVSLLKIWQWLQMDKNRLLREIKRLELQVSVLAKNMSA
jgi:hypothetical protein